MLNKEYWDKRWRDDNTGWDIGYASPPLMEFLESLDDTSSRILIPGSGNGYEAGEAYRQGFRQVYYNDISPEAAHRFRSRFPDFPEDQILVGDFFKIENSFDLILEQTSFCAHPPARREKYMDQVYKLINPHGRFAGVLFDLLFPFEGPPYGGDKTEYKRIFSPKFKILKMEKCYNSIIPRAGIELFVLLAPN